MEYRPNPQPLPCVRVAARSAGRGARVKASLLKGERFGERSECIASIREALYAKGRDLLVGGGLGLLMLSIILIVYWLLGTQILLNWDAPMRN
jgi:hypothetical protein